MCICAMNRKRPTDPIRYDGNKREKTTFESKYLKNENDIGNGGNSGANKSKAKNPR